MALILDTQDARYADPINGTARVLQLGDGTKAAEKVVSDIVQVRPGREYTLGVDLMYDEDHPGEMHYLTLRYYDINGAFIRQLQLDEGLKFVEPEDIDSADWKRVTATFTIPEGIYKAAAVIAMQGSGILFVDGVQLQRGPIATAFNPHVTEEFSPDDLNAIINPDSTPPGAPTALSASGAFRTIVLAWTSPPDTDVASYEIFRATTNNRALAVLTGATSGRVFADSVPATGVTYYYWVRAVDTSGNIGVFNAGPTAGVSAFTIPLTSADYQDLSIVNAKIADAAIDNAKIANVSAAKLTAGTITTGNIFVGSTRFMIDGSTTRMTVRDDFGQARVVLGNLGAGAYNYGIQVRDSNGKLILGADGLGVQVVGQNQIQDGSIVSGHIVANAVDADKIAANSITAEKITTAAISAHHIQAAAVTADKINVAQLSAIAANLGEITAGKLSAAGALAALNYWNLNTGEFRIGTANGLSYIYMDAVNNILQVKGDVAFIASYSDLNGLPSTLADINASEADHLASIDYGADVTSMNTANNVTNVGTESAQNVASWAFDPGNRINNGNVTLINGGKIQTGTITANHIQVTALSAISGNIGTVTAGRLQANANVKNYLNLNAGGGDVFLNVNDKFQVKADGSFTATSGSISGDLIIGGSIQGDKIAANAVSNVYHTNRVSVNMERDSQCLLILGGVFVPTSGYGLGDGLDENGQSGQVFLRVVESVGAQAPATLTFSQMGNPTYPILKSIELIPLDTNNPTGGIGSVTYPTTVYVSRVSAITFTALAGVHRYGLYVRVGGIYRLVNTTYAPDVTPTWVFLKR